MTIGIEPKGRTCFESNLVCLCRNMTDHATINLRFIETKSYRNKWHIESKKYWNNDTWCDYLFANLILFRSIFLLEIDFDTYRERFPAIHWPNIGLDELTHAPNTGKQYDRNSAAAAAAKTRDLAAIPRDFHRTKPRKLLSIVLCILNKRVTYPYLLTLLFS